MAAHKAKGGRGSLLLALAALCIALAPLPRLFTVQPPSSERRQNSATGRRQAALEAPQILDSKVDRLKLQAREQPSEAAAAALEKTWKPDGSLTQAQLQGTWRLGASEGGGMAADWPRMLLNMYTGGLGKLLDMEVASRPEVTISASGEAKTRTELRWGISRDNVLLTSSLKVVGPDSLRETPRTVHSTALSLTLPDARAPRNLRVTYFDGGLLIVRDQYGAMDLLWRQGAWTGAGGAAPASRAAQTKAPAPVVAEPVLEVVVEEEEDEEEALEDFEVMLQEEAIEEDEEVIEELDDPIGDAPAEWVQEQGEEEPIGDAPEAAAFGIEGVLGTIEGLKETAEQQRKRAAEDAAERKLVLQEVGQLQKKLEAAAVGVGAQNAKLRTIGALSAEAQEALDTQKAKVEQKAARCDALRSELEVNSETTSSLEAKIIALRAHEASLLSQIPVLKRELNVGPRDEWPSYRGALASAHAELKQARADLSAAQKGLAKAKRDVSKGAAALRKESSALEVESDAEGRLLAQLEEHVREQKDQESALPPAEAAAEAIRTRLLGLNSRLGELEAREAESLQKASEAESEISRLAEELTKARKAARRTARSAGKPWRPWRR